jgi:Na(+)-translocating NADH:ubiquinone oxidoreductase A subunit
MKFNGGYNVMLEGAPSIGIATYEKPDALHLPLFSDCLDFSLLQVEHGESVKKGQVLAKDPVNYSVPLLAPMDGTINLEIAERHITLENLSSPEESVSDEADVDDDKRQTLLRFGVWSFMTKLDNGRIPDPETVPESLVIPVFRFEPFLPNAELLLKESLDQFIEGLGNIHKTLDDAAIQLILPETESALKAPLHQAAEQSDWLTLYEVPETYPFDHPALLAQMLELDPEKVWTMDVQAVLGAQGALDSKRPYVKRTISVSGPMAAQPTHHQVPLGYPISLLVGQASNTELRIICGGVLTGKVIDSAQLGMDAECVALTILEEMTEREVMAFAQAGFGKQSYSRTFASVFKPLFKEKFTTALRGESRPCIFCGFCENVCPAGIIPHLIHRYLDNDRPEDAYRVGLDKCIECGLCSYVCLSKINHLELLQAGKEQAATEAIEG